jgi:carbon monoxide dehydrogenase subunit G
MSYLKYGMDRDLKDRIKKKLKDPAVKARVKAILQSVTKADLQNEAKVRVLLGQLEKTMGESFTKLQKEMIVSFVLEQKIDPNNKLQLLQLWNMFRW